jgi:hypothetical protein
MPEQQPTTPPVQPTTCRHRWRIASPNGPSSPGVCRLCGAVRDFANVIEESLWDVREGTRPVPGRFSRSSLS